MIIENKGLPDGWVDSSIKENNASILLKVLKSEKRKLISKNAIMDKKDKHVYPILNIPFAIPNNWIWCYLSDISIIQEGTGIRKYQYANEGVQFLTVTNILEGSVDLNKSQKYISLDEYNSKYVHFTLNKGDIVTACSGGSWGKSAIYNLNDRVILNTSTLRLRFYNDLGNNKYLYFLTKSSYFKKNLSSHSTGQQPNYGYSHYSKIPIPLPPLSEQKRIVAILNQAFTAIDKAKANTKQNLKNAREVFQSTLQTIFDNGEWEEKKLGDVCNFIRGPFGGSLKKSIFVNNGIAVYEQQHAIYNQFDKIRYFITNEKFKEMRRFELLPNDLIMSCSGTMGKIAIVPKNIKKGIINQALLKLTTSKKLEVEYLNVWMKSKIFQNDIVKQAQGAAIKNVASVKILKQIQIPLPPLPEQKQIVKKLDAVSTETKKLETIYQHKITNLDELKKSILQKAFSGEL